MDQKTRKKRIKKYIAWICVAALVALLAAMPLLADSGDESDGPVAAVKSASVEQRSISEVLLGGGTLTEETAMEITIPSGVMLTEFLVDDGAYVHEGDALAAVDRVSVMSAIAQVQETLDYLAEEIEDAADQEAADSVIAEAGGKVKAVYAGEGDSVQDVMLEYGALAVLSLDGRMAVDLETSADVSVGDTVLVTLTDGTETEGRVESTLGGTVTISVEDDDYEVGKIAEVETEDGTTLGRGKLYIHNPWNATAIYGTVSDVKVSKNDTVSAGKKLFSLTDVSFSAEYQVLCQQRREYEELMLELFVLYQTEVITAPCDGLVSGVDEDSIHLLSAESGGWVLSLLANAPNGDDTQTYTNYLAMVTAIQEASWSLAICPVEIPVTDYKQLSGIPIEPGLMTETATYTPDAPIYELVEDDWQQIETADIAAGDTLLFAGDSSGSFVWLVRIAKAEVSDPPAEDPAPTEPSEGEPVPSDPTEPPSGSDVPGETEPTEPVTPTAEETTPTAPDNDDGTESTLPSDSQMPSGSGSQNSQIGSGSVSGFTGGSYPSAGSAQEEEFELYDLEGSTILTVTPQNTMTLDITIDELDIRRIAVGQAAEITVDALGSETYSGTITEIGSAANSGGNSKFTVTLTLDRAENMLAGMNASVSLPLAEHDALLCIPVAALNCSGAETFVYTSFQEKDEVLGDPVTVTIGISDGEYVQILDGLPEGTTCYYSYYDASEDN